MKKFLNSIAVAVAVLAFAAIAVADIWFDFHVWKLQHPQAPTWTFFFKH